MFAKRTAWRGRRRGLFLLCMVLGIGAALGPSWPGAVELRARALASLAWPDSFSFRHVRFDPIFARGFVLEDVELSLGSLAVHMPALTVRLHLGALLRGRLEPAFATTHFEVAVPARTAPQAYRALYETIRKARWPGYPLTLRGGRVMTLDQRALLRDVELRLRPGDPGSRLVLHAREGGGGRVDIQGEVGGPHAEIRLEIYLDAVEIGDLRQWVAARLDGGLARIAAGPVQGRAKGRWVVQRRAGGESLHRLDLQLDGLLRSEAPEDGAFDWRGSHLTLRVTGSVGLRPAHLRPVAARSTAVTAGASPQALEGRLQLEAHAGRLPTFAFSSAGAPRLLLSGPLRAQVRLGGTASVPAVTVALNLDAARLEIGRWLRKPAGVRARLRLSPGMEEAAVRARLAFELAGLEASGELLAGGRLRAATDWIPIGLLRPWVPELDARASEGAIRFTLDTRPSGSTWLIDLDRVRVDASAVSVPALVMSGRGRIEAGMVLDVAGLQAQVGESRFAVDLHAERGPASPRLRVRFRAAAAEVDLSSLDPPASGDSRRGEPGISLPPALRAAIEKPIGLLRRARSWLGDLELESGRIEAGRVQCGKEAIHELKIDLALEERRLEVRRFSFRDSQRAHRYRGFVDLAGLVPKVDLAVSAVLPAAIAPP